MTFPILGKIDWEDSFLAARDGGSRPHLGQDLMAPKMRPLVAAFSGVVKPIKSPGHNWLQLKGDNGWTAVYMHINIDNPGTRDAKGTDEYAFAAGIVPGKHVEEGQLIAFCGDSGNARNVGSHLHFELHGPDGLVYNAAPSLRAATKIAEPIAVLFPTQAKPNAGEIRLDGFVKSVDPENYRVVLDLADTLDPDGHAKANTFPKLVELRNPGTMDLSTFVKGAPMVAIIAKDDVESGGQAHAMLAFNEAVRSPFRPGIPQPPADPNDPASGFGAIAGDFGTPAMGKLPKGVDALTMTYWSICCKYAPTYQLDPALVEAVIQRESSGNPREVSYSGAMGLMQLMPDNVSEYNVQDPFDPEQNIRGGMAQLADYIRLFGGNVEKGLLAYNVGPRYVRDGSWVNHRDARTYVQKVMAVYNAIRDAMGSSPYSVDLQPAPATPNSTGTADQKIEPYSKAIDFMLDAIAAERTRNGKQSAIENGWLGDEAEKIASKYAQTGKADSDSAVMSRLSTAGAKFSDVKVVSFSTEAMEDFKTSWPNAMRDGGRLVGLGHGVSGGRHYWVVLLGEGPKDGGQPKGL
jgi:transglycosylase-like protein with SLT domain/peptidase M23-like protein